MYGSGLKEWLEGSLLKYTALERAKTAVPEKVLTAKKAMNIDGQPPNAALICQKKRKFNLELKANFVGLTELFLKWEK